MCPFNYLDFFLWLLLKHLCCLVQHLPVFTYLKYHCTPLEFVCLCVTPVELITSQDRQQRQQLLLMNLHLLANPGDSLLLQHTLDRLIRWLCPSLRIFHVSERASPFRSYTRLCPVTGGNRAFWSCIFIHVFLYSWGSGIFGRDAKHCACTYNLIASNLISRCIYFL